MKRVLFLLLLFVIGVTLIMCSGEKKEEAAQEATGEATETTIETAVSDTAMATCPGCGMTMEKSKMVAYEEDGETEYFCSEECKNNYLAEKATEEEAAPAPEDE